ncbi:glycosyltransferase family 8 protein [Lachnospira multipara]|uniref:Lipopolysaccharide biosynthesis protein, LPS:glycosyltransferase n=1 Tax=Lachnospira multipara TaxID=28051 RepID=A0A1H5THH5_9FIRM|nr:glycosyltransferase family 8 protein [Lachnospira multipara]SEF61658.1 Lipopolysaccharide biosynthesis protein, LPS:glycosyltransferase [Lachnospira multipara]
MRQTVPIFFAIDDNYAPFLSVALCSLIENASKENNYKIHIIHQELSEVNRRKIASLARENFEIEFCKMKDTIEDLQVNMGLREIYQTITIYFRLFLPDMFPEYDKGIYIDSDIIVPGDISELYNIDLEGNLIGAIADTSTCNIPPFRTYMEEAIGIKPAEKYINSGVLLMDFKKLREVEMGSNFLRLYNKYHFDTIAPDQDYINAMCHGKIKYLSDVWDAMPTEGKAVLENPKLIHYNLTDKPWQYDEVQYESYFWEYAKKSEYYQEILNYKAAYDQTKKDIDAKETNEMLEASIKIANSEKATFKKVYESGEKVRLLA